MTPVDQIFFDEERGDCLRACVASMLDLPIGDVPNFAELEYFVGLEKWLTGRGLAFFQVRFVGQLDCARAWFGYSDFPVLAWGFSPRQNPDGTHKGHAVVAMADGYGLKTIHDPHPSKAGLYGHAFGVMWINGVRPLERTE